MSPTPILFCSHVVELGGAEHVLLDLLEGLDRRRFAPHLAVPGPGPLTERAAALAVPTHRIPIAGRSRLQKALAVWRAGRALRRLAGQIGCRLLVANSMIAGYAAVRARHPGLAVVWHLHIVTRSRLAAAAARRADLLLAPARSALEAIGITAGDATGSALERVSGGATRALVVPNGIADRFFAAQADGLRRRLGIADDALLVGLVGRLDPDKGHEVLLRAAAALPDAERTHLLFVGGELFADSQSRLRGFAERLRRAVAASPRATHVHFLGQLSDTAPLLAELDVLVAPSIAPECAPRTVAEAQAAGCPVIASSIGGVPEMIEHERTGLLVPPGDVVALREALRRLLDTPSLRDTLVQAARAHAAATYRLEAFADRCAAAFTAALPR